MNYNFGILVVDDDLLVLDVIRRFVNKLGMWSFPTTSEITAIEIYLKNQHSIKIAILDLMMDTIGGRKTYEELRYISPKLGILFSSGTDKDMIDDLLLTDHNCAFLQKPFSFSTFKAAILDLLGKTDINNAVRQESEKYSKYSKTEDFIEPILF